MNQGRSLGGWLTGVIALLALALAGNWFAVKTGARSLHPNAQAIPSATAGAPTPQWSSPVDQARQIVRTSLSERNLAGFSVAVGVGNEIVWSEGFGWADIGGRTPVQPDTRFRMGTASTILTSAAVGTLLEKGALRLDEEIQTYVPQFPKKESRVTLGQVMAHTGGIRTDETSEGPLFRQRCEHPGDGVPQFAQEALLFEPGTQYRHSKYGWVLASAAVETATNQPFLTYLRDQLFHPLEMEHTGAESAKEENPEAVGEEGEDAPPITLVRELILQPLGIAGKRTPPASDPATLYAPGFGPHPLVRYSMHVMRHYNLSCYAGSMAFFSTPSDLVRFGMAMNRGKLLQPATVQSLQSPQRLASGQETGHGLGWDIASAPVVGIDGELLGKRIMSFKIFRDAGLVVAVMSNSTDADTASLAQKIAQAFQSRGEAR